MNKCEKCQVPTCGKPYIPKAIGGLKPPPGEEWAEQTVARWIEDVRIARYHLDNFRIDVSELPNIIKKRDNVRRVAYAGILGQPECTYYIEREVDGITQLEMWTVEFFAMHMATYYCY
jgi:hypothetical protein